MYGSHSEENNKKERTIYVTYRVTTNCKSGAFTHLMCKMCTNMVCRSHRAHNFSRMNLQYYMFWIKCDFIYLGIYYPPPFLHVDLKNS